MVTRELTACVWRAVQNGLPSALAPFPALRCLRLVLPEPSELQSDNQVDRATLLAETLRQVAGAVPSLRLLADAHIRPTGWRAPEIDIVDGWNFPKRMDDVENEHWWNVSDADRMSPLARISTKEGERLRSELLGVRRQDEDSIYLRT